MRLLFCTLLFLLHAAAFSQTFSKTPLVTGVHFGVAFDFTPDGRIFVTQKGDFNNQAADAQINVYAANGTFLSEFCDLSDSVTSPGEYGLLGITTDPNFAQNHFVYCFYTYSATPATIGDLHLRVQRFTEVNNTGTQPTVILDLDVPDTLPGIHVGGNIHFRPSDSTHIYVTIGDMGTAQLGMDHAARLDNPLGKILRISKYPGAPPPSDNPFYDDGNPLTGNCDYIWAYGLRNSFDFCFGPNDSLYATENGVSLYDEVNLITRGGYYGWNECEGYADMDTTTLPCHAAGVIEPLAVYGAPVPSLTGIIFYTDTSFAQQQDHLITGDFMHADLFSIPLYNAPQYDSGAAPVFWIDESQQNGIVDIAQGPQGCIYVLEIAGSSNGGGIYMICPDGSAVQDTSATINIRLFPNPAADDIALHYSLKESSNVRIEILDLTGRTCGVVLDDEQVPGEHSLHIATSEYGLSAGAYILRITTASGLFTRSFVVTRE